RLVQLLSEIDDLAICSGLGLVTADNADRASRVRLYLGDVLLLTLRIERRCCRNNRQRDDYQHVAGSHKQARMRIGGADHLCKINLLNNVTERQRSRRFSYLTSATH